MRNEHPCPETIFIINEGFVPLRTPDYDRAFRFCRLVEQPSRVRSQREREGLIALGMEMTDTEPPDSNKANTDIPSGFVYLGQFVNHDISFDWTQRVASDELTTGDIAQGRSPNLNLSSMYGGGPDYEVYQNLYTGSNGQLRLDTTTGRPRFGARMVQGLPNDLPRENQVALVGNPLNDENLALAQTHVAFLKFHNCVVRSLEGRPNLQGKQLFERARKIVIQHYQSIILHDLLPRFVMEDIYRHVVINNNRRLFCPEMISQGTHLALPVEFALAAFRFGHSMVRNTYEWNDIFNSKSGTRYAVKLKTLFRLSKFSGTLSGFPNLTSDWIVDWNRFYDFNERAKTEARHEQLNLARSIDTKLARDLQHLPEFSNTREKQLSSLAVRDLLVGQSVGLPTGQEVAEMMSQNGLDVEVLSPRRLCSSAEKQRRVLQHWGFDRQTPLWYYILKEAEVQQHGQRLGHIGSYLVAETLHALVEASDYSILQERDWRPAQALGPHNGDKYTMTDLLNFVEQSGQARDPVGNLLRGVMKKTTESSR